MRQRQRGFSLIELLIVVAIILIIAAIAIANVVQSRERANEAAAVEAVRTLNTAQATYNTSYGGLVGFAGSLAILGPGTGAGCDQTQACLVDSQLGCNSQPCRRGAFNFYMVSDSGSAPFTDYTFTATPQVWNQSGAKNFCSVEDSIIRYQVTGNASLGGPVNHSVCSNFVVYGSIQ